jgi:hypothetical protein
MDSHLLKFFLKSFKANSTKNILFQLAIQIDACQYFNVISYLYYFNFPNSDKEKTGVYKNIFKF